MTSKAASWSRRLLPFLLSSTALSSSTQCSSVDDAASTTSDEAALTACKQSLSSFQSQAFASQSGSFRVEFDSTPSGSSIDGDIGLSQGPATAYTSMGPIVEFNTRGVILAMNASTYQATSTIPYSAGLAYHFRLDVNVPAHTYSAYVTPPGLAEKTIGSNFAFRATQATVPSLSTLNFVADIGSESLCNVSAHGACTPKTCAAQGETCGSVSDGCGGTLSCGTCSSPTTCGGGGTPNVCGSAQGVNHYYVSTTGSDTNDGSQGHPWRSIPHADAAFALGPKGAVIHVTAGTYPAGIDLTRGGSSPSVRLVLQCDPGAASAIAAIGQCKITGPTAGLVVETNNVDIVGFDVGGNPNMCIGMEGVYNGSAAQSTTANSVHEIGNYVHDLGGNCKNHLNIVGCPENGAMAPTQNQHGHYSTDGWAIGNIVRNFGGGYPLPGCNNAQGIYPSGDRAENNIVINVPVGGIIGMACNSVISNNIILKVRDGIIFNTDMAADNNCPAGVPGHNTVDNNYFGDVEAAIFSVGQPARAVCTAGTPNYYGHNFSDGSGLDFSAGTRFSCDDVSPTTFTHVAGTAAFVNYQTGSWGDYHLKAGSPLIGAGTTTCTSGGPSLCTPTANIEGQLRSAPLSVGAY